MNTVVKIVTGSTLALSCAVVPVESCCMVPKDSHARISQSAQEAVIFHRQGREELILRINYMIKGEVLPDRFAWIVTVPNEPDAYTVADAKLLDEVRRWASDLLWAPPRESGDEKAKSLAVAGGGRGLHMSQPVKVGPYEIQPIRALGMEALGELNTWLAANGFPTEDADHMAYFVKNNFTFLCIKVVPPAGQATVAAASGVPPLHLSFKSERPYYPLRFSSRQGVFDVSLCLLTEKPFDYTKSLPVLERINWVDPSDRLRNKVVPCTQFPSTLKSVLAKSAFKDHDGPWHLNLIETVATNKDGVIKTWTEDIFFDTGS